MAEAAADGQRVYTREEVARHATMDDAWAIVDGVVYDITPCMNNGRHHAHMVARDLGRDITVIFKQIHSRHARNMLLQRRIGVLANAQQTSPSQPLPPPAAAKEGRKAASVGLRVTPPQP